MTSRLADGGSFALSTAAFDGTDLELSRSSEQIGARGSARVELTGARVALPEGGGQPAIDLALGAMRGRFDAVAAPVLGLSFEDDAVITRPAVDRLHGFYRNARVERRHLAAADAGRDGIGHFGYFAPESRGNLWRDTLAWLRERAPR